MINLKTTITVMMMGLVCNISFGQFGSRRLITNDAEDVCFVRAADLDGDGDVDVLSASSGDDKIAWYENTDGIGNFGPQQIITTNAYRASSVVAVDLDGDGDQDVVSSSEYDHTVAWYENTNGLGNFGPQQIITSNLIRPLTVHSSDIDGDGDNDVISASSFASNKVVWFENTDGQGAFSAEQVVTLDLEKPVQVYTADLDGDDDLDLLVASTNDDQITWFENIDGLGGFSAPIIITNEATDANTVHVEDLDGDGDMDVLSASSGNDRIAWYKNDGLGNFGNPLVLSPTIGDPSTVYAADLDGDGFMDILGGFGANGIVGWYKYLSVPGNFSRQPNISNHAWEVKSVFAIDIDGDGDVDVLSADSLHNRISWYENGGTLGIDKNFLVKLVVFPNPTAGIIKIESLTQVVSLEVYNELGKLILSNKNKAEIDISKLSAGIYFLKIQNVNRDFIIKKVLLE